MSRLFFKPWASNFDIFTMFLILTIAGPIGKINFWAGLAFCVSAVIATAWISVFLERAFLPNEKKDES